MTENMISYASVTAVEDNYVSCELELHSIEESMLLGSSRKKFVMVEISTEEIPFEVGEGDVLVIEHNEENIVMIHGKDEEEHQRRKVRMQKRFEALMEMIG